ncbi:putative SLC9B1-like protein SLC9B1P1 [Diachasma alloeum]|uniref:putative SLC9B1-like protein SLC9B1P1 n=1 Tax=Diachasma alloeum TaxID=454923 RepID=UPI0007382AC2|nr:putative SLC9B1-like protein SLC9B1P1 [Diachasma alloeum]
MPNEGNGSDETCCGRAIFCHPVIRNIPVNHAISSCLGEAITWSSILWLLTCLSILTVAFGTLYVLIGPPMAPGGSIFGLFWLIVSSYALGWSLAYIPYLNIPPVFGMLLAGMIFRGTGIYDIHEEIGARTTGKIRTLCLTFIMIRAGLQLTTTAIQKHPYFLLCLALIPCTVEFLTVGLACKFILDYPWDWAFLTGTIVACLSPVVTVNCILALADKGYGEDRGMATLLCTAASIDDVHIVSLFTVCYSFVFTDKDVHGFWSYVPGGVRDLLLGLTVGLVLGLVFAFLPHRNTKYVTWYRAVSLILGSLMCTIGASKLAVTGGGYLATVSMSFVAARGWKLLSGITFDVTPLRRVSHFLWHFMQPVLVGIIGAEIDFTLWSPQRFGLHVLCIIIGLAARSAFAILTTYRTAFTMKERVFVAFAWLPKGTLQAALAPMALEEARLTDDENEISLAMDVVRISVVAIVFLAPLGAIIMMVSGPLLLNRLEEDEINRHRELSFLRWTSLQPVNNNRQRNSSIRAQS